jgi:Domain of unknown function (DUF5615)
MSAMRFFTDEDIYGAVAVALRRAGFDAVSTPESGRLGETDDSQLAWAFGERRSLVTFNVAHFAALHGLLIANGRHHTGIIVSSQRPIGDLMKRLLHLGSVLDADSISDRLEFLSDW